MTEIATLPGVQAKGAVISLQELLSKPLVRGDVYYVDDQERHYGCDGINWIEVGHDPLLELFPVAVYGDFATLVRQLAQFVRQRNVKLLTRKANSKKDSHVAYETVFPQDVQYGLAQVYMRCDDDKVVAAVNVTETQKPFEDFWTKEPQL